MSLNSKSRQGGAVRYLNVRLCDEADKLVRRRFRYHGDLSGAVVRSLANLNENLHICNMRRRDNGAPRMKKRPTQIGLPVGIYEQCSVVCEQRSCSMNALINSAILFFYGGHTTVAA
jgi:hypothetical protein